MGEIVAFSLPSLPPSIWSSYHAAPRGRRTLTETARAWKEVAAWEVRSAVGKGRSFGGPVHVDIVFTISNRRRWDIDNHFKLLFDACTEGGIWTDDSQVRSLRASLVVGKPEATTITIRPIREEKSS